VFSSLTPKEMPIARIRFSLSATLRATYAAKDFLQSIFGKILVREENQEREQEAGRITASLVQFGHARDNGISAEEMGDGISGSVAEYWEQLFDIGTNRWRAEIRDELEVCGPDLLILDCIEIYPPFRGHQIGLVAVDRTIEIFGLGCGLVACKPWPLQFTPAFTNNPRRMLRLNPPSTDKEEAVRKLRLYWAKAGFWPLGQTGIYVMSMSQRL
jgi:hypothetical protein